MKVTKRALKSVANNRPTQEDQLITTLVQIEGTFNSLPLTSISDDADDLTVLTPTHFISGRSLNTQGVVDINEKVIDGRRKWKKVGSLSNIVETIYQRIYTINIYQRFKNGIKCHETLK